MRHILFIMPQLGGGGAERVVSTILKYINTEKFKVTLLLVHDKGDYLSDLPDEIKIETLKGRRSRYIMFELISKINRINPDIIFSTIRGLCLILHLIRPFLRSKPKFVFREENTQSIDLQQSRFSKLWKLYYLYLQSKADKIIAQSEYMKTELINTYNYDKEKIVRIYNPVDISLIEEKKSIKSQVIFNPQYYNVIIVGRLSYQKGIDKLLNSVKEYREIIENRTIKIHLIGDGIEKKAFQNFVKINNLGNIVNFVGRVENPFIYMNQADLMILPSRYEGLPNVILEALASEIKNIIVSDHPGGTKELLSMFNIDSNKIVKELDWNDSWFKHKLNTDEIKAKIQKFNAENIVIEYENIFKKV